MPGRPLGPCPFAVRLTALFYDLLTSLAIVLVVGLLAQLATGGRLIAIRDGHAHAPAWYPLLQLTALAAYFVWSWLRGGQTLGARAWRMRVVADAGRVTLRQALARFAAAASPLLLLAFGPLLEPRWLLVAMLLAWGADYAAALPDGDRRTLHDRLSGTRLLREN
ncbi:MAG: RDD family protein [Xanthomonadaceae bacterium]|nr:RDD family protein [Xanthomonadaceae bacterium]MDE2176699.1 RDD family protein [Xanthomonadaceae bacterium]MDE2245417.1 RDD family protein [Xanthomonadaceae bacterium]